MPVSLEAGERVTFVAAGRRELLRTLTGVELIAGARVAVMASSGAAELPEGRIEVATPTGLVLVPAQVVRDGARLVLRLSAGPSPTTAQRRRAVRGPVALDVLLAVPDSIGVGLPSCRILPVRTLNVSAGGLLVSLPTGAGNVAEVGTLLDAEITLPGDARVPAVLEVVEVAERSMRTAFASIDSVAQEHLVRLVFARERAALSLRRLLRDEHALPEA